MSEIITMQHGENGELDVKHKYIFGTEGESPMGTNNYNELENKPQINNVTLQGKQTSESLGLVSLDVYTDEVEYLEEKAKVIGEGVDKNTTAINEVKEIVNEANTVAANAEKNAEQANETALQANATALQASDYNKNYNLPQINGVELKGNKTSEDLGITGGGTDDYLQLQNRPIVGDFDQVLSNLPNSITLRKLVTAPRINSHFIQPTVQKYLYYNEYTFTGPYNEFMIAQILNFNYYVPGSGIKYKSIQSGDDGWFDLSIEDNKLLFDAINNSTFISVGESIGAPGIQDPDISGNIVQGYSGHIEFNSEFSVQQEIDGVYYTIRPHAFNDYSDGIVFFRLITKQTTETVSHFKYEVMIYKSGATGEVYMPSIYFY